MIEQIAKTVNLCTCNFADCRHRWESDEIPARCAQCKRHTWNGQDRRRGSKKTGNGKKGTKGQGDKRIAVRLPKPEKVRSVEEE